MASPLDDLPEGLAALIRRFGDLADSATQRLEALGISFENVREWQEALEELIMRYHIAGYMRGANSDTVADIARDAILDYVRIQVGYLDNFALEVAGATEFENGWKARARSYANAIKVPYWAGRTKMYPVPALPGDGTTPCLGNCRCRVEIKVLNEANQDADIYWRLGKAEHCQICVQRASEWNPIKVRGGVLQL